MSASQRQWVLEQLQAGRALTPKDAMDEAGIYRLGARIWDLRQQGYAIDSEDIEVPRRDGTTARVARYSLRREPTQTSMFDASNTPAIKAGVRWQH